MFSKHKLLLLSLFILGMFFRFYDILWGSPFFFHPDERNIIYGIGQLSFPYQMNPHFFAYGSLPIYIVYFVNAFSLGIFHAVNSFSLMVFWLRFFSASLSTLMILSVYIISSQLWNKKVGLVSAFLTTFSVGFIQFAHFGTFEIWTSFFSLWLFYFSMLLVKHTSKRNLLLTGILMGILLSIKVSNLVLVVFPLLCAALFYVKSSSKNISEIIKNLLVYLFLIAIIYIVTNPFTLLNMKDFLGSIHYETSVALGSLSVFYTGSFFNTIPVVYQFLAVYPFLINPVLVILFVPSFLWILLRKAQAKHLSSVLLMFYFVLIFSSQALLFVKWTRYMVPTIIFIYMSIALFVESLSGGIKRFIYVVLVISSLIFSLSFVKTVYFSPDTRVAGAAWTSRHFPTTTLVVTEPYDLGILPFNDDFQNIVQLPSYDIDQNRQAFLSLQENFSDASLFIIPSQRLIHSRLTNKLAFPIGSAFYQNLLSNKTSYKKVYQTPCDIFCKITYMGDPLFNVEETATVFDRPTIMIFEKQ